MNELRHLGIIMDGNGRWAKSRALSRSKGHEAGANKVQMLCEYCLNNAVPKLSLFAFSTENWQRPKAEVNFLLGLLGDFLKSQKQNFINERIKFKAIGDLEVFSNDIKDQIFSLQEATKEFDRLNFNLAINYGGKDEIIRAFKKIMQNFTQNNTQITELLSAITEKSIQENLDESSDIDLLIRTGGEHRVSNFMLWQASYAELMFTPTLFPDFSQSELEQIVMTYKKKHRRFGGL
ncbi:polyprenyl diphosphate synthase [Campylobacter sp. 19-13652]|uniref:polyprenyl diphosphate synthase n=1 Tax=Campylobacter sp. 19-13652 TaxID=2840180 RepID=UPI001C799E24|nr:polyprenyl diphosphate synthase [Campylobacter sp. 19-13652]BCX79441.1 isoprenyl transferase [Campylobacter sp. 19-13652]